MVVPPDTRDCPPTMLLSACSFRQGRRRPCRRDPSRTAVGGSRAGLTPSPRRARTGPLAARHGRRVEVVGLPDRPVEVGQRVLQRLVDGFWFFAAVALPAVAAVLTLPDRSAPAREEAAGPAL